MAKDKKPVLKKSVTVDHLLLGKDREWWMKELPPVNVVEKDEGELTLLPEGWWGGPPAEYYGPPTRCLQRGLFGPLRNLVGCGRRRYRANGFDLDLSYVTTKIVAMSFPCTGCSALWRNPKSEVERFLDTFVTEKGGTWKIYNLCREKNYQENGFPKVSNAPDVRSPDHCPISLLNLHRICVDMAEHLKGGDDNMAAIHCKAGKGRTGTVICAFLVYAKAFSALDAVRWYAHYRGGFKSGVTIPSQVRWIAMFEHVCRQGHADLLSNPLVELKGHLAYRLIRIRAGSVGTSWKKFLRLEECSDEESDSSGPTPLPLEVQVSLSNRYCITKGKKTVIWKSEDDAAYLDSAGNFQIDLDAETAAIWREPDGLLRLKMFPSSWEREGCRRKKTLDLKAWWCHSFLKRTRENELSLILPRGYLDYMDMGSCVPDDFSIQADFEELPADAPDAESSDRDSSSD